MVEPNGESTLRNMYTGTVSVVAPLVSRIERTHTHTQRTSMTENWTKARTTTHMSPHFPGDSTRLKFISTGHLSRPLVGPKWKI